jgi:drug/metabolite transporter (DMT)-like permease
MQPAQSQDRTVSSGTLFALLLLVDSLHFIFARALLPHISPWVSAMYVLAIGTVEVGLFGLVTGRLRFRAAREHLIFFTVVGLLVAASTAINYASVSFIDAGTASMLGKMTTVYSIGFGLLWLHDRLTRRQIVGTVLAIIGVFVITFQPVQYLRVGSLMIVFSTFLYALHAAIVKRYGGAMDFLNFFFFRLLFTTSFLFVIAVGQQALAWPTGSTWVLLALAGTVDVVISRSLYYLALRRLPITLFAVILTLSPVIAIGWALLLFNTFPSPQQLVGGLLVLLGVLLATFRYGN